MTIVKSVTKALNILEVFQTNKSELAFGEIVDTLKISNASAYRIISTLVKEGFLKQQKKRGKYSLGIKLFDITESNIRAFKTENTAISNMLVDLSRLVNGSVSFTVWYGSEIMFSRSFTNDKTY
jgi:DNA-binding IclR family transcriptional regulator